MSQTFNYYKYIEVVDESSQLLGPIAAAVHTLGGELSWMLLRNTAVNLITTRGKFFMVILEENEFEKLAKISIILTNPFKLTRIAIYNLYIDSEIFSNYNHGET